MKKDQVNSNTEIEWEMRMPTGMKCRIKNMKLSIQGSSSPTLPIKEIER